MMTFEDKRLAASKLGLNCGSKYFGVKANGFKFCALLIEVIGDTLIFENKKGVKYFDNVNELKYIEPYTPRTTPEKNEVV